MTGEGLRKKNGKRKLVIANNDNQLEEDFYEMVQNGGYTGGGLLKRDKGGF